MAQERFYRNDTDGLPIEHDPVNDQLTISGLLMNGDIDVNGNKLLNVANGTDPTDGVNFQQLQDISGGLDWKESVRLKATGDYSTWTGSGTGVGHTLTSPNNATTNTDFDGVTAVLGDRILVIAAGGDDSTPDSENGIYTVTQLANGSVPAVLTRATDQDEDEEYTAGNTVYVEEGACAGQKLSVVTANPITVDTTPVLWSLTGAATNSVESERGAFVATAGAAIAKGDPVYPSANDTVSPIDNTNNHTRKYCGVAQDAIVSAATGKIQYDGILESANVAGSPAAGDIVWANTPNGTTVTLPTGSGTHRLVIGKMLNATDLIIEPEYIVKLR